MAGVDIKYKDATIATIQGGGSKTLKTGGKYCEDDITVDYVKEGITPSGNKDISANGTYDVSQYAVANVNVSAPAPTLIAKNITANGTYNASSDDADGYSAVNVNVPTGSMNSRCFIREFASKVTSTGWIYFNDADPTIAAHINDPTFVVTIINVTDYSEAALRTIAVTATNHVTNSKSTNPSYGMIMTANSSGTTGYGGSNKAVNVTSPASGGSQICVTADGRIGFYNSAYTSWEAGTYVAVCGW